MKNFLHDFIDRLRSDRRYMLGMAFVAAAVVIALIFIIAGSCRGTSTDCKYPYTYRISGRTVTVTINGPFDEGCGWSAVNRDDATVSVTEKKQDVSKAVYDVTVLSEGLSHVDFVLVGGESTADVRYTISFDFFSDSAKKLTVSSTSYYDNGGFSPVSSGTDVPYSYSYDSSTRLHVVLQSDEDDDWQLVSASDLGINVWRESSEPSQAEFVFSSGSAAGLYFVRFLNNTDSTTFELPILSSGGTVFVLTYDELSSLYSMVSDGDISSLFNSAYADPGLLIPDQSEVSPEADYLPSYDDETEDELPDYLDPEYYTADDDYVEPEENYAESEF